MRKIDFFLELIQWNPDFSNLQGKRKLVEKVGEFGKSGVKLVFGEAHLSAGLNASIV